MKTQDPVPKATGRAALCHDPRRRSARYVGPCENWPNVCPALKGEILQKLASVPAPSRSGPERSTTTEYTFVLARDAAAKDEIMPHAVPTMTANLILCGPPGTGKT